MKKRNAYVNKIKKEIDEINKEIKKMEKWVTEVEGDVREEYEQRIEKLKRARDSVKELWVEVSVAGENSWMEIADGLEKSRQLMRESLDSAVSKFFGELAGSIKNRAE